MERPTLEAELIHYNIKLDEALFILTNEGCAVSGIKDCDSMTTCQAGKIDDLNAEMQQLFGIVSMPGEHGFMGAAGLLMFGSEFNYSSRPDIDVCHGMDCDVFETCLNDPAEQASVLYVYYWTTEEWHVHNDGKQVPIAMEIFGTGKYDGSTVKEVMMRYDFFDFRRDWVASRDELEPPANVYCVDRKNYITPPKAVQNFNYKSELVLSVDVEVPDGDNQTLPVKFSGMFPSTEWYDWTMRITRADFIPPTSYNSDRRFENLTTRIHEFNQGLSYIIMDRQHYCHIQPIENITSWGDVKVNKDGSVSMQSPWNFEDMNQPMQYNGAHWERGLKADVWVGVKEDSYLRLNETYVWYYATPLDHDILGEIPEFAPSLIIPTFDKIPVKLEKYITQLEALPHLTYNIYGFDSQVPTTYKHDISTCYASNQMRHFQFDLPANSLNKTHQRRDNLMYGVVEALGIAGKVTPLRINRLEIKQTAAALQVIFTLLEKPTEVGDVGGLTIDENSMNKAATEIRNKIDGSQLVVLVQITGGLEPLVVQLVGLPGTMKEIQRDDGHTRGTVIPTGYSSGDMGGLAVGMLILGGIVGYAGIYIYSSRK
ncbi:uncharacterized protein LOC121877349 [Homarus americanus]|uniref:uncharacterized protein LOC121877349 n=1 Tax=Homarus americanus TaxID=6706 RepID=UPI001C489240|nr:uncharacterized protein LOC121877349 [Homarus americanus]